MIHLSTYPVSNCLPTHYNTVCLGSSPSPSSPTISTVSVPTTAPPSPTATPPTAIGGELLGTNQTMTLTTTYRAAAGWWSYCWDCDWNDSCYCDTDCGNHNMVILF